jgi:uncharacterized phage protein gp47/JayE
MAYGLTKDGLITKTFDVVTAEIQQELTANLGQLNFDDNTVIGNMVNIFAEREVFIWQLCQSLYDSFSPTFAEGISLDYNCALLGIKRLPATYSYVTAQVTGENFSILPSFTLATIPNTSTSFSNIEEISINNESCIGIKLQITTDEKSIYKITINNEIISYTKQIDDTIPMIAIGLSNAINSKENLSLTATVSNDMIDIISQDYQNNFSCILDANSGSTIVTVTSNVLYYSNIIGAVPIPSGALTEFINLANGIISINNYNAGFTGSDLETDIDLRIRRKTLLSLNGRSTLPSIRSKLFTIPDVIAVTVNENATASTVDNIPPYSFECIIYGGTDELIAKAIWDYKPVGISSYGSSYFDITDSTNHVQRIYFSRPTQVYVFISIAITKNDTFNTDSVEFIKDDIVNTMVGLGLGQTLYYQSLYSIIYKQDGVVEATIQLGKSYNPSDTSASLSTANITAGTRELLIVEKSRITITVS